MDIGDVLKILFLGAMVFIVVSMGYQVTSYAGEVGLYRTLISEYCNDFQQGKKIWEFYCLDKGYLEEYYCSEKKCVVKK